MATVTSNIPEILVEGKLIIFPAYTFYLQERGYIISQRNDKVSNRKLNEILMKANLAKALKQEYQIPHIMVYDNKKWTIKNVNKHSKIIINAGQYGMYHYFPTLVDTYSDTAVENVLVAYLSQYSSAKISIKHK